MDRTTLEHDLIDLLDGTLPPDRAERVRAALASDSGLRREVERMARDRGLVAELRRFDERGLRADAAGARERVRAAVEMAERQGLLGSRSAADAQRGAGARKRVIAGVSLAAMLSLVAGVATLVALRGERIADSLAGGREKRDSERLSGKNFSTENDPIAGTNSEVGPPDPRAGASETSSTERLAAIQGGRVAGEIAGEQRRLDDWISEAVARVGADPAAAWKAVPSQEQTNEALARARGGSITLEDAAVLAFTHRLRVVAKAKGDDTKAAQRAHDLFSSSPKFNEYASAGTPSETAPADNEPRKGKPLSNAWTMEVHASLDPERQAVRAALTEVIAKAEASGLTDARFEVVEPDASAAMPAVAIDDVLWWTRASTSWARQVSLRVDVVVK